jgi:hypothetical protein
VPCDNACAFLLQVLKYMWFAKIAGGTHQEKLESFYKDQASSYVPNHQP